MKNLIEYKWYALRVGSLLSIVVALDTYPREKSNLDWWAAGIIGLVVSVVLFIWLTVVRFRSYMEWSKPYDFSAPFFPMNRYPLRYWIVVSFSLMAGGAVSFFSDVLSSKGNMAFGGTFFILGLGICITIKMWVFLFKGAMT